MDKYIYLVSVIVFIVTVTAITMTNKIEILTYVTYNNKEYILKRANRDYNCIYGKDITSNEDLTLCGNLFIKTIIKEIK